MISICLFGAGRIGAIHAANIAARDDAELRYVIDVSAGAASAVAAKYGARVVTAGQALADEGLDAVVIASPTDTHAGLICESALAAKAIFCEKPVDLDIANVDRCLETVAEHGVPLLVGFNRRFDDSFRELKQRLDAGAIGAIETVVLTSRDPGPPPIEYIEHSGGLFRDMMIHDFDMARWLLPEEPSELFAVASCLVDPAIAGAGDVDTAMVVMRTAGGSLCQISNNRRAVYGYDQRIEVFGSGGMLRAGNELTHTVKQSGKQGTTSAPVPDFFLERYANAYRRELDEFIGALSRNEQPPVSGEDGRRALLLADAATESVRTGLPVKL
jgi:myo-inositol 2-dehydrogenase/D-chiro-inositol 1-dehydrogenase